MQLCSCVVMLCDCGRTNSAGGGFCLSHFPQCVSRFIHLCRFLTVISDPPSATRSVGTHFWMEVEACPWSVRSLAQGL